MPNVYQGNMNGNGLKIGVAVSRFNTIITENLLKGAVDRLVSFGVADLSIDVVWVPGAFELPQTLHIMEKTGNYDGVIALGCVIRGDTPHFDYVCNAAGSGITRLGLSSETPVVFGVLTCDTFEQAQARAGVKSNKGIEAADSLVELINVFKAFSQ